MSRHSNGLLSNGVWIATCLFWVFLPSPSVQWTRSLNTSSGVLFCFRVGLIITSNVSTRAPRRGWEALPWSSFRSRFCNLVTALWLMTEDLPFSALGNINFWQACHLQNQRKKKKSVMDQKFWTPPADSICIVVRRFDMPDNTASRAGYGLRVVVWASLLNDYLCILRK